MIQRFWLLKLKFFPLCKQSFQQSVVLKLCGSLFLEANEPGKIDKKNFNEVENLFQRNSPSDRDGHESPLTVTQLNPQRAECKFRLNSGVMKPHAFASFRFRFRQMIKRRGTQFHSRERDLLKPSDVNPSHQPAAAATTSHQNFSSCQSITTTARIFWQGCSVKPIFRLS